ncbi:Putative protein of unknown function [Podospora comata]|uniref:Uncharacterized protein n=1 Tax=Podospora comata TaxID=48703 RepID=A0ABY6SD84_PODCO|nr:Putative protein of unknown function [Podospora comata]
MSQPRSKTTDHHEPSATTCLDVPRHFSHVGSLDVLLLPENLSDADEASVATCELEITEARSISSSDDETQHVKTANIFLEETVTGNSLTHTPDIELQVNFTGSENDNSCESIEACSPVQVSEEDIELQDFTGPHSGTRSTDHLTAPPDLPVPAISPLDAQHQSPSASSPDGQSQPERSLPNYKPIALTWPFQVFLLAIVIGMFAFLEYQIHDLPPLRYKALQMGQQEIADSRDALLTTSTVVFSSLNTLSIEAKPLPRSPLMAPTPATLVRLEPTVAARDSPEPTPKLRIMVPRPDKTLYPSPQPPVTAFCGWGRPYWNMSEYQYYNLWDTVALSQWYVALEELIPVFTTTDPSWCPCTVSAGYEGNWPWGWPDLPMWDTHDEGCKSVMNAICSFNYYKVHTWSPKGPSGYQFRTDLNLVSSRKERGMYGIALSHRALDPMTTPPSSHSAFWGYPLTDSDSNIMFPLEVRTARLEQQDVFGNKVGGDEIASFPVNYRWMADTLLSTEISDGVTPCSTDMMEVWWYQDPLGTCTGSPSSYATVWWTLPFGKPVTSDISETQSHTTIPVYASLGIKTSNDMQTHSNEPKPSGAITEQEEPSKTTLSVMTTTETVTPSPGPTSGRGPDAKPISRTENTKNKSTQSASSETEIQGPVTISSTKGEVTSTGSVTPARFDSTPLAPQSETTASVSSGYSLSIPQLFFTASSLQGEQGHSSGTSLPPLVFYGDILHHDEVSATIVRAISVTFDSALETTPMVSAETSISQIPKQDSRTAFDLDFGSVSSAISAKDPTAHPLSHLLLIQEEHTTKKEINNTNEPTTLNTTSQEASTLTSDASSISTDTSQPPPIPPNPPIGPIPPEVRGNFFNLRSETDYLMASLIPVLLATLLGIPVQIAVSSLNSMLPFRALGHETGTLPEDSLHLPSNSWLAPWIACRFLHRFKDPLPFLNVLLGLLSTILIPLSAETIRLEFTSINCKVFSRVCAFGLRKAGIPMRAAEGVLVAIAVLVIAIGVLLSRWKSRVATEPWSIASMAGLLSDAEVRGLVRSLPGCTEGGYLRDDQIASVLTGRRYRLGFLGDDDSEYGIEVCPAMEDDSPIQPTAKEPPTRKPVSSTPKKRFWHMKPTTKEFLARATTLLFVIGLLILILYYENTILDTPFRFMDSQSFGVRILFTSFGTIVSGCWDYFFSQVSHSCIHRRLSTAPQLARTSILLSPPSNIFTGLWQFARSRDVLFFNIAFAALLAKFTPILFSSIPFRNTVTWKMHEACTWLAVAVLSYMVIVLAVMGYLGWKQPQCCLPVKTDTLVGCMYYLAESEMLSDFEGMGVLGRKERDRLVSEMGRLYYLGAVKRAGEVVRGEGGRLVVDYFVADSGVERKGRVREAR